MKVDNLQVIDNFLRCSAPAASHTGNLFYANSRLTNYSTVIAQYVYDEGRRAAILLISSTFYSRTTSKITGQLKRAAAAQNIAYELVTGRENDTDLLQYFTPQQQPQPQQ